MSSPKKPPILQSKPSVMEYTKAMSIEYSNLECTIPFSCTSFFTSTIKWIFHSGNNIYAQQNPNPFTSKRTTILKGISGTFNPGELTAIMGPSGAGKSTLNNFVSGYKTEGIIGGEIKIRDNDGQEIKHEDFCSQVAYIMQEDCLSPHLTVEEAMNQAAKLKLSKYASAEERKQNIKNLVENLGLSERLKTRTSQLSGGQMKRLAIGLEMLNNPPVMIFDEPTSGLDAVNALHLLQLLKKLAEEGRTIVCTIHQPSARIFDLFDSVTVLSFGETVYKGKQNNIVPFLERFGFECPTHHNPADFIIEVASEEHGSIKSLLDYWKSGAGGSLEMEISSIISTSNLGGAEKIVEVPKFNRSQSEPAKGHSSYRRIYSVPYPFSDNTETILEQTDQSDVSIDFNDNPNFDSMNSKAADTNCYESGFGASGWIQFYVLFYRTFLANIRDNQLFFFRIFAQVAIGILLGFLYQDIGNDSSRVEDNVAMLFFCILFSMFTAMMPTIMTYPSEMKTFKREYLNNWYSIISYYFAKSMADLPFQIILPSVFVTYIFFMTSQPLEGGGFRLALVILMCVLTSLVAQSLGLVIGCACDEKSAVFLGPISVIPLLLFSGFFIKLKNIPSTLHWISYVAFIRYGYEGTMGAIYGNDRENLDCINGTTRTMHNMISVCQVVIDGQSQIFPSEPESILSKLGLEDGEIHLDVAILLGFFVVLRILGLFILWCKVKSDH